MTVKRSPPRESWESLQRQGGAQSAEPPAEDTAEELVWRAVSAGVGADLLDYLRSITIEKRNTPGAPEADLRELEAQRALVNKLQIMRDRGAEIAAARSKPKAG